MAFITVHDGLRNSSVFPGSEIRLRAEFIAAVAEASDDSAKSVIFLTKPAGGQTAFYCTETPEEIDGMLEHDFITVHDGLMNSEVYPGGVIKIRADFIGAVTATGDGDANSAILLTDPAGNTRAFYCTETPEDVEKMIDKVKRRSPGSGSGPSAPAL